MNNQKANSLEYLFILKYFFLIMLVMKSGKRHLTDGMELPNQNKIRMLRENETYLEGWHHQTSGNERQNSKRILQEN